MKNTMKRAEGKMRRVNLACSSWTCGVCRAQGNTQSRSEQGRESVQIRFGTVTLRVSCFRNDRVSECVVSQTPRQGFKCREFVQEMEEALVRKEEVGK